MAPVPSGSHQWVGGSRQLVGIHFCHPEVVKLQQQCHKQNTIFDLLQTTGSIHFFLGYNMLGGGGGPVPSGSHQWVGGSRQWVGIHFCHPKVVKLQQQCHKQNTIFDLLQTTGSIHFFLGEGSANILEKATGELEGKMKMAIR